MLCFFSKIWKKDNYLRIFFFALIYILYQIALILPRFSQTLDFIGGRWNWEGKFLGIILGIISYFAFRKYFSGNDFFTLQQQKENFKKSMIAAIAVIVAAAAIGYLLGSSEFDFETLAFQLTMPGFDEEIMFRGILLGLLMTALRDKVSFLGNPSVLLTAVLFGFLLALILDKDYSVNFEPLYFLQTGLGGYVWGWIAVKSRSILLPMLSHNFGNFLSALAAMLK